jgi:hypothetical protein
MRRGAPGEGKRRSRDQKRRRLRELAGGERDLGGDHFVDLIDPVG